MQSTCQRFSPTLRRPCTSIFLSLHDMAAISNTLSVADLLCVAKVISDRITPTVVTHAGSARARPRRASEIAVFET